jgi:Domain of unknown function (DUF4440)
MHDFTRAKKRSPYFLCAFVSFAVCLVAGCAGAPKHPTWSNATGGEQHERLMWQEIHDKNWTMVERHLSPTFVGVNARGETFDRAGWIAYWKSAPPAEISLGEQNVQPEGPDMKLTYIMQIQGGAGPASGGSFRVISIWQDIKARWVLTATSITPLQGQ